MLLALLLAILSVARISFPSRFEYRQAEVWTSQSKLFLTEPGFPWGGRSSLSGRSRLPRSSRSRTCPSSLIPVGSTLSPSFYAQLANSDQVLAAAKRRGLGEGTFYRSPSSDDEWFQLPSDPRDNSDSPFGRLEPSRPRNIGTAAFRAYLSEQQGTARIPADQRVKVDVVSVARGAVLTEGRRHTLPVVVFLSVVMAFMGLAFVLENLRPRASAAEEEVPPPSGCTRRQDVRRSMSTVVGAEPRRPAAAAIIALLVVGLSAAVLSGTAVMGTAVAVALLTLLLVQAGLCSGGDRCWRRSCC